MKICFIVNHVSNDAGFENVVSGHVQMALYTMQLLKAADFTVHLITTKRGAEQTFPKCMPEDIKIHYVVDGRVRGGGHVMNVGHKSGVNPFRLLKQLYQIKKILYREEYDIVHLVGSNRMAYIPGLLSCIGFNKLMILSFYGGIFNAKRILFSKFFYDKIFAVVTSTNFITNKVISYGLNARLIRHGIVNEIFQNQTVIRNNNPFRVLFWRDPSWNNGADVCIEVFSNLAPRYPDIDFDFAVRPHSAPVSNIYEIEKKYDNIHVFHFPYDNDITIKNLIEESICILLPFRKLSIHPQFSVIESMLSRVPVVTTALDSNNELITTGIDGLLVPVGDVNATINAVEKLITNRVYGIKIGNKAAEHISLKWNWDNYIPELLDLYEDFIKNSVVSD